MSYRKLLTTKSLNSRLRDIWEDARFGRRIAQAATGFGALAPLMALANPTGGQVVGGAATITTPNANKTQINQTSQNAAINWQQFSVGANQYVQFLQPNSSSVVLNRVIGGNPSSIFGNISANGQVFLINPNGILFGRGATLDVSGLVASTQSISDTDFMAGRYKFTKAAGAPDASVINQGIINANSGYVVLAGDYVENDGMINAQSGRVLLAAGGGTTLTLDRNNGLIGYSIDSATLARLAGVNNTGSISADGGTVIMTADVANALTATAVNNSGFVAAHSITSRGGVIVLMAKGGDIDNSGTLDASAAQAGVKGGTVIVHATGGDTKLTSDSKIDVTAVGADGGFIDVSGHEITIKGQINGGKGARLVLDPSTITIEGVGSSTGTGCSGCEGGVIHTKFIQNELNAGLDLTIVASNQIILGSGARGAPLPTAINATGSGKLSLKIGTTHIQSPSGGTLHRITSSIFDNNGPLLDVFTPIAHGIINISGLNISIAGGFVASASKGAITLGNVTAKSVIVTGSNIFVGNLMATGGTSGDAITITASNAGSPTHISTGKLKNTTGSITLITRGNGDQNISIGGSVNANGRFLASAHAVGANANGGDINITGDVMASRIRLLASGNGGGNITTKTLHANGTSGSIVVNAVARATAFSSGDIKITGNVTADHGNVSLSAQGGGDSGGGGVTVTGSINAAGSVNVVTHYIGSSHTDGGGEIHLGNVTGRGVNITANSTKPLIVAGNVTATSGVSGVQIRVVNFGSGSSNITTGAITSSKSVTITTSGSAKGNTVTVAGITANTSPCRLSDCNAGNVSIDASHGIIDITGDVTITHDPFRPGNVTLNGRSITAGNISAGGRVALTTRGSGASGANIKVGNITAGSSVFIGARYTGVSSSAFKVQTGTITGEDVRVLMNGHDPKFSAAGITATGPSASRYTGRNLCSGECGTSGAGTHHGFIGVKLTPNGASGSMSVTGPIVSQHGGVELSAGHGAMSIGSITAANNVFLSGNNITVAAVTAGTSADITGVSDSNGPIKIVANGLIKGRKVSVAADPGNGFDASIDLKGGASATGLSTIEGGGSKGITITALSAQAVALNITTGPLHARGGDIVIDQGGALASGSIHVTGSISAATGNVKINETGFGNISVGTIHAGINASVNAHSFPHSHGSIIINGNVVAGNNIRLDTSASGGGDITVRGGLTANDGNVDVSASGSSKKGGNIDITGSVHATSNVALDAFGAGTSGGRIQVGNVTASKGATIIADYLGSVSGFTVNTGKLTGQFISVQMTGIAPHFSAAGMAAGSSIRVQLVPTGVSLDSGVIHLTGPVVSRSGSINLNPGSGSVSHPNHGLGSVNATNITAKDNISIFGDLIHVGALTVTSGNVTLTGVSDANQATSITVTGAITAKRVDIAENFLATAAHGGSISLQGQVTAASGATIEAVSTTQPMQINLAGVKASNGSLFITQDGVGGGIHATGLISAAGGNVNVTAHGSGGISVATVTAHGSLTLKGSGTHAGSITVNGSLTALTGTVRLSDAGIAAGITVNGSIDAPAGSVSLLAAGAGGITVNGSIDALHNVSFRAVGSHAGRISINGSISGGGEGVNLTAQGNSGNNIVVNGNITVGVTESNAAARLSASAGPHSGGSISVAGKIKSNNGGVVLNAHGGGAAGGRITVGSITAHSGVSISANYAGNSPGFLVKTGAITAVDAINIRMTGKAPHYSGAGMTQTGSCECGIRVQLHPSVASGSSGVIDVSAAITAARSVVSMNASHGAVTAGAITDTRGSVFINGSQINVGAITAINGSVTLTGEKRAAGPTLITVTGAIVGRRVNTTADSGGSQGATIALGNVTASGSSGQINIGANLPGQKVVVTTGNLTAANAIGVHAVDGSGSMILGKLSAPSVKVSLATGNITVGGITAANGASVSAGGSLAVTATGNLALTGGALKAGKALHLHATGDLTLNGVSLTDSAFSMSAGGNLTDSGAGTVNLTGRTLKASKTLSLHAGGSLLLGGAVLSGSAVNVTAAAITNSGSHGSITASGGTLKATGVIKLGGETFHVTGAGPGLSAGGSIDLTAATVTGVGNLTLHAGSAVNAANLAFNAGSFNAAAGGKLDLTGATLTGGKVTLSAGGNIVMTGATLTLGSLSETAGGSVDLSSVTATITHGLQLKAKQDIILSGVHLTTATFLASASGTIHNGGGPGAITADAMAVVSNKNINLSSTAITLGSGAVAGFSGDTLLLAEVTGFGIGPRSSVLNGTFLAGGTLSLGDLTITGHYLVLQGTSVAILGNVTAPTSGLLVQVMPSDPTAAIGVEGNAATTQAFNLSNQGFFALFPGDTIAIGGDTESGAVFIGANGAFTLAPKTNLFFDTTGAVTGPNLITTTGLVTTLEVFVAATGADIVTVGEVDPSADSTKTGLGDETDKKRLGQTGGADTSGQQGPPITNQDNPSGVCH